MKKDELEKLLLDNILLKMAVNSLIKDVSELTERVEMLEEYLPY